MTPAQRTDTQRMEALAELLGAIARHDEHEKQSGEKLMHVRIGCGALKNRSGPEPVFAGAGLSVSIHMPERVSHAVYCSTDAVSDPTWDVEEPRYHAEPIEALRAALDNVLDRAEERAKAPITSNKKFADAF